ncbi:MAG: hypothetical protein JWO38_4337, partial [Gemmataceae bacterium]|nr:hypothetical protein [Gemmataceae bacterium]
DYGEPRPRRRRPAGRGVLFWLLVIFLGLGVLTTAACGGMLLLLQAKWRPHQSDRGGFKVDLPAEPRADMADLAKAKHQPNVSVEGTLLLGKLEEYSVVYADVEPATRQLLTDDAILEEAVKGLNKDTPGLQVLRDDPATVSGFPAREVVFTHPNGGTYTCLIVIADTRLYIASAGGPWVTAAGNDRVRRFLDSLRVTDPKLLAKQKDLEETRRLAEEGARRARGRPERDD